MAVANDSVLVTAGSGTTIATHLSGGKEHQVVVLATPSGQLYGTEETWIVQGANSANVAAARTSHFDLFNDTGSGVTLEVWGIYIIPTLTAVSGVGLTWEIIRTSAVGTGGTTLTPRPAETTNTALPAGVTARLKPTGGATTNYILLSPNSSSEETNPYAGMASQLNHLAGLVGSSMGGPTQPLVIRENEGIKVDQTTNSAVGSTNIVVVFSRE